MSESTGLTIFLSDGILFGSQLLPTALSKLRRVINRTKISDEGKALALYVYMTMDEAGLDKLLEHKLVGEMLDVINASYGDNKAAFLHDLKAGEVWSLLYLRLIQDKRGFEAYIHDGRELMKMATHLGWNSLMLQFESGNLRRWAVQKIVEPLPPAEYEV